MDKNQQSAVVGKITTRSQKGPAQPSPSTIYTRATKLSEKETGRSSPFNKISSLSTRSKSVDHEYPSLLMGVDFVKQFESVNSRIDKLTLLIEGRFADICKRFSELTSDMQGMKNRIASLEQEMSSKDAIINELLARSSHMEQRQQAFEAFRNDVHNLGQHVSKLEENTIASNVIIRGIPIDETINLSDLFKTLCTEIKCTDITAENIYRLKNIKKRNINATTDAGVIVKLKSPTEKVQLLKAAAVFRKENNCTLSLKHAGINSQTPIYINECLTQLKKHLLNAAIRLKKQRKVKAVFTLRGKVFIRPIQKKTFSEICMSSCSDGKITKNHEL